MKPRIGVSPHVSLRAQAGKAATSAAWMALAIAGCSSTTSIEGDVPSVSSASEALIGGFAANSSEFNAVGSIVATITDPWGGPYPSQVCTGTLIDDDTVLTAKHCLDVALYSQGAVLTFGLGPNALAPTASAEVIAYEVAPGEPYGGFSGYGTDVAVLHLGSPLTDAPTASVGRIGEDDVGDRLATFGYGEQFPSGGGAGMRAVGAVTVGAVSGRIYEVLFGDFETFHMWYAGTPVPPQCADVAPVNPNEPIIALPADPQALECLNTAFAKGTYEFTLLEDRHELYVGGVEGDAQPCYGDSGGPLVRPNDAGDLVVFGVVSGSVYMADSPSVCGHGATYAGFSEETIEFIEAATAWEDPCELGTSTGICDGTVARRCSTLSEGENRRELSFDCASAGTTCQLQQSGYVGCGEDDSSFAPPGISPIGGIPVAPPVFFSKAFKAPGAGADGP